MKTVKIGIITNIETNSDEINQIFKYLIMLALYLNICFEKEITR